MSSSSRPSPAPTPGPSRRPPSKLRVPTSSRKASNPSLSLVYASPAPAPVAAGAGGSSSSRSEEVLSRQLDGDSGGKQMGLRSRRSSSATIRTINTLNGAGAGGGPQSPRESIAEEAETEEEGPILERMTSQDSAQSQNRPTRLNPKASSSWLRWNSPAPSFPRSDKGKGRERPVGDGGEGSATPVRRASTIRGSSAVGQQHQQHLHAESTAKQDEPAPTPAQKPEPDPHLNANSDPQVTKPALVPDPTPSKARGWFSRNPSPDPATAPTETTSTAPGAASAAIDTKYEATSQADEANGHIAATPVTANEVAKPDSTVVNGSKPAGGWTGYLSWGRKQAPPPDLKEELAPADESREAMPAALESDKPAAAEASTTVARDQVQPARPASPGQSKQVMPATLPQADADPGSSPPIDNNAVRPASDGTDKATASTSTTTAAPVKQTWGNFLYNIVVPQIPVQSSVSDIPQDADPTTVQSTSPTEEQRPIHTESEAIVEPPQAAPAPDLQPPAQSSDNGSAVPSASTPQPRKGSQASTTAGWLNYLAFRASQKRVEQPVSVTTRENEEVMDFSNDPDFPAASSPPHRSDVQLSRTASAQAKTAPADQSMRPPASTAPLRNKRLSNSSMRSASSVTPIPPSPRSQSKAETTGGTTTPKTTSLKGPSSLPPPPQQPAQQPNLVIPTFSTTFDRPPRSFKPQRVKKEPDAPPQQQSGLAWRALGAMGSYVYPGSAEKQEPKPDGDPKESRGRKEGRSVGADLPRRLGLETGHEDEGWKNVKRVVVVGVHGWFPAKMLNSVIGEPTGTSSKFANMMGAAVKRFFDDKGMHDIRLTLIPLEGEGTIEHRVDRLYKSYLSNAAWINDLRRADAVFFAAHSQGCIVTTHLLSRLIAQGHIRTPLNAEAAARCSWAFGLITIVPPSEPRSPVGRSRQAQTVPVNVEEGGYQKVCMLAMCGVHQGPLYSIGTSTVIQPYLQWFENAAARELFEFQDTTSAVSQAYQRALAMVLENDVRMVLLSSLNDQVVPIYGSSFSAASHPLLLRALFVDGASYSASDFMTNLLCFAFMLRNAGISDEHLIEHLSEATAGSLTGLGHSAPYEEPATFQLAVDYLFHAGLVAVDPMPELQVDHFSAREGRNDFELPWIMRAIVDSPEVKDLFPGELRDLKEGILHWKPTTKALRDIKKRLEPMAGRQSKLRPLPTSPSSTSLNAAAATDLAGSPSGTKHLAPPTGLRKDW